MAKLDTWTGRQASALLDSVPGDEEDEAFLRPAAAVTPQGRRTRAAKPDPAEEAEAFLRARRRVHPRKGGRLRALLHSRLGRAVIALACLSVLALLLASAWAVRSFLQHDPHFRIDSSSSIEAAGNTELSRTELVNVFGSDIGRNVFFVPLARREAALEALPWVRHATVMRLLPNTLRVTIEERVPAAFVRVGREIELVDGEGVLLSMPPAALAARHYSFPVVTGLDPNSPAEGRAARMHLYGSFIAALDSGATRLSPQLSEVDLADLDDVRAVVPAQGTDMLLHFGNSDFLDRFQAYQQHVAEWRQQYPNLSAVDLRYDRQVVLKMAEAAQADEAAEARPFTPPPSKAAVASSRPASRAKGPAKPYSAAFATHGSRTWYTETRTGPHHAIRWVPHTGATASPSSGRAQ